MQLRVSKTKGANNALGYINVSKVIMRMQFNAQVTFNYAKTLVLFY